MINYFPCLRETLRQAGADVSEGALAEADHADFSRFDQRKSARSAGEKLY